MFGSNTIINLLKPYKANLFQVIVAQILTAIFTVVSIPLIIPFFQILFEKNKEIPKKPDSIWDGAEWLEYYFANLIETYQPNKAILYVCIIICLVFLLKNLFRYLALIWMNPVRYGIVRDLRSLMFGKLLILPEGQRNALKKGDIMSRFSSDLSEVEWSVLQYIEVIFKAPIIIIGALFFMLFISPQLSIFVLILLVFTIVVIGGLSRTLKKDSKKIQESVADITSVVDESLDGFEVIKSYNAQDFWKSKFSNHNESYLKKIIHLLKRKDLSSPLSELLGVSIVSTLLYYGSFQVLSYNLPPETFFAFIFAFYQVIEPSKSFASAHYNIKKGAAALERIDEFLKLPEEQEPAEKNLVEFNQDIHCNDVYFKYPNAQEYALNGLTLKVSKGEKIAIVGPSGAGKSTLIKLLLKAIQAQKGFVKVDGLDLNNYKTESWYNHIALVSQESFIFNDTLYENIDFGRKLSVEKIKIALKQAHLEGFVDKLDQRLGDRGAMLSGGEKQRVSIARALANNPEILVLDEPTSALDAAAERAVNLAIQKAMEGRTSIVIAHRLSTVQYADKIYVMENGKITSSGTHTTLLKSSKMYRNFVDMQSLDS